MLKPKKREWILLADQAHVEIFTRNYVDSVMQQYIVLEHPAAREHQSQKGTDRPGRGHGSGSQRHAYEDHADFPEQESIKFLQGVAQELNDAASHDEMDQLILVALPKTLAKIKAGLTEQTKGKVVGEYTKNLIGEPVKKLKDHLIKLEMQD